MVSRNTLTDYLRRYLLLACGLVVMAFGVALSIKANIGISPISCFPYVLSQVNDIMTVGQFTAAMHIAFVALQILLLRKQYQLYQLLQLVVAVALGVLIDAAMLVLNFLHPTSYPQQFFFFLLSTVIVSLGMFLEVKAGVLMVAGEGLVKAIAQVTGRKFSQIKIIFDCTLVAISVIVALIFLHSVVGVREGTVGAAILVGLILGFFNKHIRVLDRFLEQKAPFSTKKAPSLS